MSGSLIKIYEEIVTSAVASVTLTGIDSTYDVYMVKFSNLKPTTDNVLNRVRILVSSSADTSSNYDFANKGLRSDTTFDNNSNTNGTYWEFDRSGNATGENTNATLYLFNFNNASEYNFITTEFTGSSPFDLIYGATGGGVHTVAQASNGIEFFFSSGNIDTGSKFTLYGLKK
ncbi:hypothetical protein N8814_05305 [Acidimicrobiia bacterium]|nr:hypothetical protein [Acidimicrobiia bacterium]